MSHVQKAEELATRQESQKWDHMRPQKHLLPMKMANQFYFPRSIIGMSVFRFMHIITKSYQGSAC